MCIKKCTHHLQLNEFLQIMHLHKDHLDLEQNRAPEIPLTGLSNQQTLKVVTVLTSNTIY